MFRAAVQDIAATPEGAAALARFNAGDRKGALAILDKLQGAVDAALQKRTDIERAVGHRSIAALALEARAKGDETTAQVIERYEEVTRLDPGVNWDWAELSELYRDAGTPGRWQRPCARPGIPPTLHRTTTSAPLHSLNGATCWWPKGDGPGALAALSGHVSGGPKRCSRERR